MSYLLRNIDPELPEGSGEILSRIPREENFSVPLEYFEELPEHILGQIKLETAKSLGVELNDETYFDSLESRIMSRIRLDEISGRTANEFSVPENYFQSSEKKILHATAGARVISMRWKAIVYPAIAAAAVVTGIFFFKPFDAQTESFAVLLEETELTEDYLEYFATEDDYYQLWLDEVDELIGDTLVEPTIITYASADSTATDSIANIHQRTPTDKNNAGSLNEKTKPEKNISFDDLTEDEIWEYLLEEGGDEIFED